MFKISKMKVLKIFFKINVVYFDSANFKSDVHFVSHDKKPSIIHKNKEFPV